MELKNRRLSVVSNAEPYKETSEGQERIRGGLTAAFDPLMQEQGGIWIAWGRGEYDFKDRKMVSYKSQVPDRGGYTLKRVPLTREEEDEFYYGFSNGCLWPTFHGLLGKASFNTDLWETYKEINERYTQALIEEHQENDLHWIQDYHLMLVPKMLRKEISSSDIGFFLHIPWPAWDDFRHLPWGAEIIEGLLGADIISFHVPSYVNKFFHCVRKLAEIGELDVDDFSEEERKVKINGRTVKVVSVPLGIDYELYKGNEKTKRIAEELKKNFHARFNTEHFIWGLDRIDFTKGIPERFKGFEYFLENNPKWRGKVSLIQKATPSRRELEEYRKIQDSVSKWEGRISGKFGKTADYLPVNYSEEDLPLEELIAHNHVTDIALITPLVDGMNLAAKEWVAGAQKGTLILSQFAGFAEQLRERGLANFLWEERQQGAILVNPRCEEQISEAIKLALEMPEEKKEKNLQKLKELVEIEDLNKWRDDFIGEW